MQIYILFSSLCLLKFNKNSKNRCYLLYNSTNNGILVHQATFKRRKENMNYYINQVNKIE